MRIANMETIFNRPEGVNDIKTLARKGFITFLGNLDPKRLCLKPRDKLKINVSSDYFWKTPINKEQIPLK